MFVSCFGRFRLTISELDCEQSLFPSDLVRVVHARDACGHLRVSRVLLDGPKKERLLAVYPRIASRAPLSVLLWLCSY